MSDPIPHVLGELSTYLDQQLSNSERQRVEKHLKGCESCAHHYKELLALRRMLHENPALKPPPSFYKGVLNRIENPAVIPSWFSSGIPAKAFASACLVMLVVWVTHETRRGTPPVPKPIVTSNPKELDPFETHAEPALASVARRDKEAAAAPQQPEMEKTVSAPVAQKKMEAADALQQLASTPAQNSFGAAVPATAAKRKTVVPSSSSITTGPISEPKNAVAVPMPEWKGEHSGIISFRTVIVENAADWLAMWHEHTQNITPPPALPEIDFTHTMVIGLFDGQKPTGGYGVEIIGTQQPADVLIVTYKETTPAPGAVQTPAPSTPFHLKVIPQSSSLIQFKKL